VTADEAAKLCDCASCPFAKDGKPPHKPVLGEFNSEKPIAILIGEGPGEEEVRQNRPFVGTTGQELNRQLERAGIPRAKTVVLNATACRPPPGKTDQMLGRATKCCAPLFRSQYDSVKGKNLETPTLAMGKWAAYAASGKATATETGRGFIRQDNLLITYHPTYAFFRNPWVKGDFLIDLERFKRLIDGKLQSAPTVITEPTVQHLHTLLNAIAANANRVAVDIETGAEEGDASGHTGKDPTRASLKTIALGTDEYAVAFKWPITNGMWDIVSGILLDPAIVKIFHNGYFFDLRVLDRYGIKVVNVSDTREIRRALVATSGLSLRYLAQTYVDFPAWKEIEDEK
jgi:uracil-DNA glycosylase family 4